MIGRACIALGLAACGTDFKDPCPAPDYGSVPAQATAAQVQPILAQNCAVGGCHLSSPGAAGLVLDVSSPAWMHAVVGVRSQEAAMDLVAPGDPDRSWLVHKIYGQFCGATCDPQIGCGAQMPFGAALSDGDRGTIVGWISSGAASP